MDADEVRGITKNTEFVVFADRSMASALGTVVGSNMTAFTSFKFVSQCGDETPFRLGAPGYALQTRVGDDNIPPFRRGRQKVTRYLQPTICKQETGDFVW